MINNDKIKEELRPRLKEYMEGQGITFNKNMCKCILPGHDDNENKPNMSYNEKTNKVKCFKCESLPMDLYGVIKVLKGYDNFQDQLAEACNFFNIKNPYKDNPNYKPHAQTTKTNSNSIIKAKEIHNTKKKFKELQPEENAKINTYIDNARANIENKECLNYLRSRGIENIELLKKYDIGYSLKTYEGNEYPSIILPNSIDLESFSFTGLTRRQLLEGKSKEGQSIKAGKAGVSGIFNLKALYQSEKPVFITEGEINALSVAECSHGEFEGVATGSVSNTQIFIDLLKQRPPEAFIIIELDDDYKKQKGEGIEGNRGKEEQAKIEDYFKQANISFLSADTVKACQMPDKENKGKLIQCNDQNDALKYDREAFLEELTNILKQVEEIQKGNKMIDNKDQIKEISPTTETGQRENKEQTEEGKYLLNIHKRLNNSRINMDFVTREIDYIETRSKQKKIKTGFNNLDKQLGGGLESGLYLIGAIPGMGKTAFYQQIGENLVDQGFNVLYFALEMDRHVLFARKVSRMLRNVKKLSISAKEILNYDGQAEETKKAIMETWNEAGREDPNKGSLYLIDNSEAESPADVISRESISYYIDLADKKDAKDKEGNVIIKDGKPVKINPIVIVDYVQILKRLNDENSLDKKSLLDKHMEALKGISIKYNIPVLVISSVNRDSYKDNSSKLTLASLKESGDIEYYAEVIFLLDYNREYINYKKNIGSNSVFDFDTAKEDIKRNGYSALNIIIAKDRNGEPSNSEIYFYGKSTYFTESNLNDLRKNKKI